AAPATPTTPPATNRASPAPPPSPTACPSHHPLSSYCASAKTGGPTAPGSPCCSGPSWKTKPARSPAHRTHRADRAIRRHDRAPLPGDNAMLIPIAEEPAYLLTGMACRLGTQQRLVGELAGQPVRGIDQHHVHAALGGQVPQPLQARAHQRRTKM